MNNVHLIDLVYLKSFGRNLNEAWVQMYSPDLVPNPNHLANATTSQVKKMWLAVKSLP